MNKGWKKVIIISLMLVILEMVITVILVRPFYKCQVVYNSIDEGNWIVTKDNYDKLTQNQKDRVQSYLPDYAKWLATSYMEGNISYEEIAASFDAVNVIDTTKTLYSMYMGDISQNEYVRVMNGMHSATDTFDSNAEFEYRKTLNAIIHRLDNDTRENILIAMLNYKYSQFLDEKITPESMKNFCKLVLDNSYYAAYDYAELINNNLDCVIAYRAVYENAVAEYDKEKYLEAMELCNMIQVAPEDSLYEKKINDLYAGAYDAGKEYYKSMLDDYVAKDDKKNAIKLMGSLKEIYGNEIDLDSVTESMASEWQLAAIDCTSDWEPGLKKALGEFSTGEYILEHEYEKLKPDSILLYDVNGDMIPEMFLFNSGRTENEYVECFAYAYVDEKYTFLDYINIKNFCSTSDIVAFPYAFDRTAGDESMLVSFNGSRYSFGRKCQKIGGTYYVDGTETDDISYLEAQTQILSTINEKTVGNSKYGSLEDSSSYILAY